MRWTWIVALALGCTGSPAVDDDGTTDDGTDGVVDTDTDTDIVIDTDAEGSSFLTGTVVDVAGVAIEEARVAFCRGTACRTQTTDDNGGYDFGTGMAAGPGSFEIVSPEGSNYATAYATIDLPDDFTTEITVTLPERGNEHDLPVTAAEIEVVPGFFATAGESTFETPLFRDDAEWIAGVEATDIALPVNLQGEVLGVWYLEPFDYHAPDGVPFAISDQWTTVDASDLKVYVGVYLTSTWDLVGGVTLNGDRLDGDSPLPLLSTVVLVREN